MDNGPGDVTRLLEQLAGHDPDAAARLVPLLHNELNRLARHYMRHERPGHTLQPTALVNEAYLRLAATKRMNWRNRAHFIAVAAGLMRRILIDHARRRKRVKRGGSRDDLPIEENLIQSRQQAEELVDLDEALGNLKKLDARQSQIVELRFFGGLTVQETAEVLGISPKTVKRDWSVARAWLRSQIRENAPL